MGTRQKVLADLGTQKTVWDFVGIMSDIIQKRSDVVFPIWDIVYAM